MDFRHELVLPNMDLPFKFFIFEGTEGNYRVQKHWHQPVEIFLVLHGKLDFYINEKQYPLSQRQFILVNSNEIHSIEADEENFTLVLQIPRSAFSEYTDEEVILFKSTRYEKDAELIELMEKMYEAYEKKEYGYHLKVLSEFYTLLYILVTKYQVREVGQERIRQDRKLEKLSKITNYMRENFREELTLEGVAEKFGFSPTYLSRMFHRYASINYKTYLLNLRVEEGYRLLLNTDLKISEIAEQCGFPDGRSFSKAFFKRFGKKPSEYKKEVMR